jgi:hypothetical protein
LLRESVGAGLSTTTMSALASAPDVLMRGRRDSVPQVSVTVPAWRYLWHARHEHLGILLVTAAGGLVMVLLALGVARMWSPRRRATH